MSRTPLTIRQLLILAIGTLSVLVAIFTLLQVGQEAVRLQKIRMLISVTRQADQLFDAAEKLSVERDVTFFLLHTGMQDLVGNLSLSLQESRKSAQIALPQTLEALRAQKEVAVLNGLEDVDRRLVALKLLRDEVDRNIELPIKKRDPDIAQRWFRETTTLINQLRQLWMDYTAPFNFIDPTFTLHLRFKYFLAAVIEYASQTRALIGKLIVLNAAPTPDDQSLLLRWQGMTELSWTTGSQLAAQSGLYPAIEPQMNDARSHYMNLQDMTRDIFFRPGVKPALPYPISADFWLELSTETTDSLFVLKDAALTEMQHYVSTIESEAWRSIMIRLGVLLAALALCGLSLRIVTHRVLRPIHDIAEVLIDTTQGRLPQGRALAAEDAMAERNDEIGKLAQVLQSLQTRMAEIRRYNRELERSNKELDDFAYIASHDLKEPLRGISNHARFLQEDNEGKLDAESTKRIGRLIYLSQRIERLVTDLLYFSTLGRQELAIQPADIGEVVEDIAATMEDFLTRNGARIVVTAPLPVITCNKTRVTEVFRNLIVNAVKYNRNDDKTVEIGYLETAHVGPRTLRGVFYVKDNGQGIPQEFHDEIFRIFRRVDSAQAGRENGTGVGLTFVKKIIERHGGRIWLTSAAGQGTTFYFTLQQEDEEKTNVRYAAG